jgi:hypothetical protein
VKIMGEWYESELGQKRLALENATLNERFSGINARPKFVTYNGTKYLGYEAIFTTEFEHRIKKVRVYIRYPKNYLQAYDKFDNAIKVFPLEILDANNRPSGEQLETGASWHRWPDDGRLCMWYTGEGGAEIRDVSIVGVVAWASTWWWCYNYKKKNGVWPAKEK